MAKRPITPPALTSYRDDWHMSPGIETNNLLFLTGMTGHGEGADDTSSDHEQQIRKAFEKVQSVLIEAGLDMSRLIEMTTYHIDMGSHIDTFRGVRDEFITEPYPAWTAIGVTGLITDGTIVEICVVADATAHEVGP